MPPEPPRGGRAAATGARSAALALLVVGLWAVACDGQPSAKGRSGFVEIATMTRGPATAPVSIVEFSDYQ